MRNWTIKIELKVADSWVADGFDASERLEQIEELLADLLPCAEGSEFKVKATIAKAPDANVIREIQGYQS